MFTLAYVLFAVLNFPPLEPDKSIHVERHDIVDKRGVVLRQVMKIDGHVTGAIFPVSEPYAVRVDAGRWVLISGHVTVELWMWEPARKRVTWLGAARRDGSSLGQIFYSRLHRGGWAIRDIDPHRAALRTVHVMPGQPIVLGVRGQDVVLTTVDWDHGTGKVALHSLGPAGASQRTYAVGTAGPAGRGDAIRGDRMLLAGPEGAYILELGTGALRLLDGKLATGMTKFTAVPHATICMPVWNDQPNHGECVTGVDPATERLTP